MSLLHLHIAWLGFQMFSCLSSEQNMAKTLLLSKIFIATCIHGLVCFIRCVEWRHPGADNIWSRHLNLSGLYCLKILVYIFSCSLYLTRLLSNLKLLKDIVPNQLMICILKLSPTWLLSVISVGWRSTFWGWLFLPQNDSYFSWEQSPLLVVPNEGLFSPHSGWPRKDVALGLEGAKGEL